MSITAQNISYQFPNGNFLFEDLNFTLGKEKIALVGPNGIGKSTLLDLITGTKKISRGKLETKDTIFRLPQNFLPFYSQSVIEILGVKKQLQALRYILAGKGTPEDHDDLNDEWDIEIRVKNTLEISGLSHIKLGRAFESLSGGEMSRLLFARILLQQPDFVLLDEPTNHLDSKSRQMFYHMIERYKQGMLIVSHDRELLRRVDRIMELSSLGISLYGGNFDFYQEQKRQEALGKQNALQSAEMSLKRKVAIDKKKMKSQEKRQSSGKKRAIKSNVPKVDRDYFQNKSEQSTSKLKKTHEKNIADSQQKLDAIKSQLKANNKIKIDLNETSLPKNKRVLLVEALNFSFTTGQTLWKHPIKLEITGPQRWSITGDNGSGKSTLVKVILKELEIKQGEIIVGTNNIGFIDQQLLLLNSEQTILENVKRFNTSNLPEGELRIRLARFLFFRDDVHKQVSVLSGGERMRAGLACLLATNNAPDLLILDEPTNNLDLESLEEVVQVLSNFNGALLVISHDQDFLKEIGITHQLILDRLEKFRIELM